MIAEMHNADVSAVPSRRLPYDLWEFITCFLLYADVVQLAHTSRHLWSSLMRSESIWEQQLRFFHEGILDMRGGSLLMTDFAIPHGAGSVGKRPHHRGGVLSVCDQFWHEKKLYVLDAHREWHFEELSSLEDKETGVFTVPLHLGHETLSSSAAAPFSRPSESPESSRASVLSPSWVVGGGTAAHEHAASGPEGSSTANATPVLDSGAGALASRFTPSPRPEAVPAVGTASASPSGYGGTSSPVPQQPVVRMPAVGAAFVGPHRGDLRLQILRPIRPGEAPSSSELSPPHSRSHGEARESMADDADGGHSTSDAAPLSMDPYLALDQPASLEDEDAALAYVLALSEAEAKGQSPPPPPVYRRSTTTAAYNGKGRPPGGVETLSAGRGGASAYPQLPFLQPSELLTVMEMINSGMAAQSRVQVRDVTAQQPHLFLQALEETLKSAKRRRLHLGNHHRAVLNNGQTTRNRSGQRHQPPQSLNASSGPWDVRSASASSPLTPRPSFADPSPHPAARSPPVPLPAPPPVNRILRYFTGRLMEVTKREAHAVSSQLMRLPELVDDFDILPAFGDGEWKASGSPTNAVGATTLTLFKPSPSSGSASHPGHATESHHHHHLPAVDGVYPRTRFFLLPELLPHGFIGLILVDAVRVLVAVEKDRTGNEEGNTDWELEEQRLQAGRLVRPGRGFNAQYYERDQLRPL